MDDNEPIVIHRNVGRADRIIEWIETHLKITIGKAKGQPFLLADFQKEFIRDVYEPEDIEKPGHRLVTQGTFSVGRKNGKSELAGCLVLVHLLGPESEGYGEIVSGATTAKQAKIVFRTVCRFLNSAPNLKKYVGIVPTTSTIYVDKTGIRCEGSTYSAIAAGPDAAQGMNPSLIIMDELGFARNRNFFDAMAESQGARDQPFMMIISTQNKDDTHVLSTTIDHGLQRRPETKCSVPAHKSCAACGRDQRAVVHLYAADPDTEIMDEDQWRKSNPALGQWIDFDRFKARAVKAYENPSEEASFRLYRLNQRVSSQAPLLAASDWRACCDPKAAAKLPNVRKQSDFMFDKDEKVYVGLDMSKRNDLTAFAVVSADNPARSKVWFWKPEAELERHSERDAQNYKLARDNGWLIACPGRWINHKVVLQTIKEIRAHCRIEGFAYDRDPKHMEELLNAMLEEGITAEVSSDKRSHALQLVPWGQTHNAMDVAVNALESAVIQRRFQHDGNPLMMWNVSNAMVDIRDDKRKLVKHNDTGRIDGAVALAMAMGLREIAKPKKEVWNAFNRAPDQPRRQIPVF